MDADGADRRRYFCKAMPEAGLYTLGSPELQPRVPLHRLQNHLYCPRQFCLQ